MARTQVSWGSLCYWTWRLLFMFILVSSFCSLSLILLVYFGQKRPPMSSSDHIVNGQLQDFIHKEVYGEQNLFEMKNKVARNRFLIISYSTESRIVEELSRNKKIFLVNAGQKLEETEREGLQLDWRKKPSTATVISLLNLIRNVFDCEKENSSRLITARERNKCRESEWRAVQVTVLGAADLEPILVQYEARLKVVVLQTDPRSLYFSEIEQKENSETSFSHRLCSQMVRDQERLEEFASGANSHSYAVFTEELLLLQFGRTTKQLAAFLKVPRLTGGKKTLGMEESLAHFIQGYDWLHKEQTDKVKKIDSKCSVLFDLSIYTAMSEKGTFSLRNVTYPIRI